MLALSAEARARGFLVLGVLLFAIYAVEPALIERSVQSGPVISSSEFRSTPEGYLASSKSTEKTLKQKISLQPGRRYRIQLEITGASGPAVMVVDVAQQAFKIQLNAGSRPLMI